MSVDKLRSHLAHLRNGLNSSLGQLDEKSIKDARHGVNLLEKTLRKLQGMADREAAECDNACFLDLEPDQIGETELMY